MLMMSIILAGLSGFLGYCWVLIDWYQDVQLGRYEREPLNTLLEAVIIMAYCYLAFRFLQFQLNRIQSSDYPLPGVAKAGANPQLSGWFGKRILTITRSKIRGQSSIWISSRQYRSK
jgi:hypothetical protein